ncbi:hypothetical protein [Albibacterium indicum]|uniref:hypothetical protein n=1 Tax=Albibacterium indicum TaxID=2292082 RepID=UPI00130046AE|nr:hypothetical protein [Pedobacter indicus]
MKRVVVFFLFILLVSGAQAQTLKGIVMELDSSKPIQQVEVKNVRTDVLVETTASGEFSIDANVNDLLTFGYPGYRLDTLVVVDHELKRVYMTPLKDFNILEDVEITDLSDVQLEEEIRLARERGKSVHTAQGGGIAISPSRLFGREAKEARRRYELLIEEKENRVINARFNEGIITPIIPLKGRDLDLFMVKFRPSYEFVEQSDDEQIRLYIMDSYKEFKNMSQAEKDKIKLIKQTE